MGMSCKGKAHACACMCVVHISQVPTPIITCGTLVKCQHACIQPEAWVAERPLAWVQAASKTNDTAGDGTTTATILSAAIIAEGMKIVAAGTNPIQVRALPPSPTLITSSRYNPSKVFC